MARQTPRSAERGPRLWRTLRRFWSTALASELEYQANALVELLAVIGMANQTNALVTGMQVPVDREFQV